MVEREQLTADVELEAGLWLGTLSPMDQQGLSVGLINLDPSPGAELNEAR